MGGIELATTEAQPMKAGAKPKEKKETRSEKEVSPKPQKDIASETRKEKSPRPKKEKAQAKKEKNPEVQKTHNFFTKIAKKRPPTTKKMPPPMGSQPQSHVTEI